MNKTLTFYYKKIETLNLREQCIVSAVVVLVIFFIWYIFLFGPIYHKKIDIEKENMQLKNKLADLNNQLKGKEQEMLTLQPSMIVDRAAKITLKTDKVIPMLQELMSKQPGLELVSITTRPPVPIALSDVVSGRMDSSSTDGVDPQDAKNKDVQSNNGVARDNFFRHLVTIHFQGDYFSTLQFLEKIESLPWLLVHDRILYTVKTYPQADVTMQINLLSFAGELI